MICKNCNNKFFEKYSNLSNGDFCSIKCARSYAQKQCLKGTKIVKCITCKKEIEVDKRASELLCKCNDCKKTYKKKIKTNKSIRKCSICKKNISLYNNKSGLCFDCFTKKRKEEYYNNYIKRWKDGLENGLRGKITISHLIRKYLFEKYNNKCSECGWNEINKYTNNIPLEVEHEDGDYKNNKEENLKLLCPNCHSLTKTYKGANKGNGRPRNKIL